MYAAYIFNLIVGLIGLCSFLSIVLEVVFAEWDVLRIFLRRYDPEGTVPNYRASVWAEQELRHREILRRRSIVSEERKVLQV